MGHFQRDGAAEAVSTEHVGSVRLDFTDFLDIECGNVLEASINASFAVEAGGLQAPYRLIGTKVRGERTIEKDVAFCCVYQEERSSGALPVDGDERIPVFRTFPSLQNFRKRAGRGSIIENSKGK